MPVYVLPTFNITVNIWRIGNPTTNPPDVVSLANLSPGRIVGVPNSGGDGWLEMGGMWLRLPYGTDIQDGKNGVGRDVVECPATSQRYYDATWVDDIGGGFPNEHRFAILMSRTHQWPTPYPAVGGPFPPPPPGPPIATGGFNTGGFIPVNAVACPITAGQLRQIIVVATMNQAAIPLCDWNGGAGVAPLAGAASGVAAFGVDTGQVLVYDLPVTLGAGIINVKYPGVAMGFLFGLSFEWGGNIGVLRKAGGGITGFGPQAVPGWGVEADPSVCYCVGNLQAGPPPATTAYNAPWVNAVGNAACNIGGAKPFRLDGTFFMSTLAGTYNPGKALPAPPAWAIAAAGLS